MDPAALWQAVQGELELTLSKANFGTWFKGTFIYMLTETDIVVAVPNTFTREWFEKKYHQHVEKTLKKFIPTLSLVSYKITTLPPPKELSPMAPMGGATVSSSKTKQKGTLNKDYTFDSFVVGSNNRLAYATAQAVANQPGTLYNPLFIYGGVGLGKTHLLQAIGNAVQQENQERQVLYVSCEDFMNEFISSINERKMSDFKRKYRDVDVFLVDDIQFISHKEGTQEEFFHTFNALHQKKRQIVITSDRIPRAIPALEDRLSSRFGQGMVADIQPPNFETRQAILRAKCQEHNFAIGDEALAYIAQTMQHSIRELVGALNRVITIVELHKAEPTLAVVQEAMESLVRPTNRQQAPEALTKALATYFGLQERELVGRKRTKEIVYARQILMHLLRTELNLSYPQIGKALGGKDHSTVMYGCRKVEKEAQRNEHLRADLGMIKESLYAAV